MTPLSRLALGGVLAMLVLAAGPRAEAQSHRFDCAQRTGIDRARCERHERMYAKCGPIKGEAHFACDREFLLAHPLQCTALAGDDAKQCQAEVAAFKTCEPKAGREFMRCVREQIKASPMGAS